MPKVAYRLTPHNEIPTDIHEYLYDIDEDFTTKEKYIERAKQYTNDVNKEFNTDYKWYNLFPKPKDIGWRYCSYCREFYWNDDYCECD